MNVTPIIFSDYRRLAPFFVDQPYELCPYSLGSIIAWTCDFYEPYMTMFKDDLVVLGRYKEERYLLLPIAPVESYSPLALQDLALDLDVAQYRYVSRQYLDYFGIEETERYFHIREQPVFHDYVYGADDLAQLKGNRYAKKRNLINQFDRAYVQEGRVRVAPIRPGDAAGCIAFLEKWCDAYDCDAEEVDDLACEKQAAINALNHIDQLGMQGIMLRIDGEISAFGIWARLTRQMGVLHFEKAFSDVKGLYQYFDRECARQLFKECLYINKESDMGIAGLKKAKKSYYPLRMVKSYQLTVR